LAAVPHHGSRNTSFAADVKANTLEDVDDHVYESLLEYVPAPKCTVTPPVPGIV
jgi:hypothetical protein